MLIKENFQCTQQEFDNTKSSHNINIKCLYCQEIFQRQKKLIVSDLKNRGHYPTCCSVKCLMPYKKQFSYTLVNCKECNIEFKKIRNQIIVSPNHFCSKSCAARYNNKHKTHGTRRSKLEAYIEQKLTEFYPNLEILYSNKTIIESELDIYIPSLKLAFELNGIFHYEPIFGDNKLNQIQNNDSNKFQIFRNIDRPD